jgi:hypothetical protein
VRVWEGERGRHRGGIERVCVRVWEGERGRHRREVERVCESVRGREEQVCVLEKRVIEKGTLQHQGFGCNLHFHFNIIQ